MTQVVTEDDWLVVRTQALAEERAIWHLKNQGFEVYLPRYRKQRRHARRVETVLRPLFPGYVFVRLGTAAGWRSINGTIGVLSLVQFGAAPAPLANEIVEDLKASENDGAISLAPRGLCKGDRVSVRDGVFAGTFGLLEEIGDEKRAILLLDLLGRQVRVSASLEQIAKAS